MQKLVALFFTLTIMACNSFADNTRNGDHYSIHYGIDIEPADSKALITITLTGKVLPSRVDIHFNSERHSDIKLVDKTSTLKLEDGIAHWQPEGDKASLSYRFQINHQRDPGKYDSIITKDWAIMRSDKVIPPIKIRARKGLQSQARLELKLPSGWSSAMPYEAIGETGNHYRLNDTGRRFIRPKGWLIIGDIASRSDMIAGVEVRIATPGGQGRRLQDSLAFINWTLPCLRKIFNDFPPRILIVSADDPMWRGGLSAPNSLFMHADRPLISGNRTSSLIHELIHVGTSIHGTSNSDWIVEGIAEYYAAEILHRSGGISEQRYTQTITRLKRWGEESGTLFTGDSSGPTTARAVGIMYAVDQQIRQQSGGKASLDNVASALAEKGGRITVRDFVELAEKYAGGELKALAQIRKQMP
ncbi:MAG: hypothetical protein ACK5ME_01725 [Parahaliea sp.]